MRYPKTVSPKEALEYNYEENGLIVWCKNQMSSGRHIKDKDLKLLWGRSAGRCAFPECNCELTCFIEGENCTIGEMAHVISHSPNATTRNDEIGGNNTYENLILLCPTHHTLVDKEELKSKFPADLRTME